MSETNNNKRISDGDIKSELLEIREEFDTKIKWYKNSIRKRISFKYEKELIEISIAKIKGFLIEITEDMSEINWKILLREMVAHESIHEKQYEYLFNQGLSSENIGEDIQCLSEIQAFYEQNSNLIKKSWRYEANDRILGNEGNPTFSTLGKISLVFSKKELKNKIQDQNQLDIILKLEKFNNKIKTKKGILSYRSEFQKILKKYNEKIV